jgi:dihydroorotate dehydrogenase
VLKALVELARPALFVFDPEQAHELTLKALETGLYPRDETPDEAVLGCSLGPLTLPNPVGIAAGFDKDARVPDAVLGIGCGFAEVGTLTPLAQEGKPRPRIFRLIKERAVINRLGFNNGGHAPALARLAARARRGIIGVNIGANMDAADRIADYVAGLDAFYGVADYFTVNISSPNTPGLRDLQAPAQLDALLDRLMAARDEHVAAGAPSRPLVVKLAPDIAEDDLPAIVERLVGHGVDGVAVSNTTLARPGLANNENARQSGGLSGRPLFHRSTVVLARVHQLTAGRIPLIGIGGIDSGETALAKIEAGASLIQLYTGLIYEGPGLISRIKAHLARYAREHGLARIGEATGRRAAEWAAKPLDG